MTTCVVVSSSNNTFDVFERVYRSFAINWRDCPYPLYVGLNSLGPGVDITPFQPIFAPRSNWQTELRAQITSLPASIENVILFLDDFFLISPVDTLKVTQLVSEFSREKFDYLRLIALREAALPTLISRAVYRSNVRPIPRTDPYYCSLQVAIWKREHLINLLNSCHSIWDFETQKSDAHHFAVVRLRPIDYRHLVEKGKWMPYADNYLRTVGTSHSTVRRTQPKSLRTVLAWRRLRFALFGYVPMRLKRFMARIIPQTRR